MADVVRPFLFGWKLVEVVVHDDRLALRSGTVGIIVEVEDEARCFKHEEHLPPVANCSCGFFAKTKLESLVLYAHYPFSHLLEVELSGRNKVGRDDLRAQYQRALRLLLLPHCYRCGQVATVLAQPAVRDGRSDVFPDPALTSMCEECAGARWWLLDEVAGELAMPVSWALASEGLVLHGVGMNLGDH